jgi:excinuclease ABC subunit A
MSESEKFDLKTIRLGDVHQNNLKGVDIEIPIGSFTVVCGPSGSGKSSLAFETLYAEGQRRYIESLSNYSKQFLNKAPKPDVGTVANIPPAISIDQKNSVKSSRSTVGTTTEVIDYLRLIYEKIGKAYCPDHHISLERHSPSSGAKVVLKNFSGERGYVAAKVSADGRVEKGKKLLNLLIQDGYARIAVPTPVRTAAKKKAKKKVSKKTTTKKVIQAKLSGEDTALQEWLATDIGEVIALDDPKLRKSGAPKSDFYIIIDRLSFAEDSQDRIVDSLSQAYSASIKFNKNILAAEAEVYTTNSQRLLLNEEHSCTVCGFRFPPITSALFSFNSPVGACSECNGFGNILTVDEGKVIPNPKMTLSEGAIVPFAMPSAKSDRAELKAYCKKAKIDMHTPWEDLSPKHKKAIWSGNSEFYGVLGLFEYLETKKYKMHVRVFLSRYKSPFPCKTCGGSRLKPEAQQVLVKGHSISDLSAWTLAELSHFMNNLEISDNELEICAEPLRQVRNRLRFLNHVGVGYLTCDRPTRTLSGGEFQRLNLANQLGMGLSQTLYVLDEPTVGLHPRDNDRLIEVLKGLRDLGNTLVIVEHDYDVIKNSTHVIEMGPGSGHLGGEVIYAGGTEGFYTHPESNTAGYLQPGENWVPPKEPRAVDLQNYKYVLSLQGCTANNLKNVTVDIPLHRLVTVTGVSGSGKSSLISSTLYPAVARKLGIEFKNAGEYKSIHGTDHVKNVVFIDQSPIGKTARSNPVTYLKVYDAIRQIFAGVNEARQRGYTPGTFSLNVEGGRCPVCKGLGHETIDMMFMDDIEIPCEACDGKRFRPEILEIKYHKRTIYDILNMTVAQAMDFFVSYPNIRRPLSILREVGLEYLTLGQTAKSLSGGESQRLKVAKELNNTSQRATLYIMDEPTTGLHFREVHLLLNVLNKLVDNGSSVLLIEHNLEIIKNSDFIIDIGPEAGEAGGKIIAQGSPYELMNSKRSLTGKYLKDYIQETNPQPRH